MEDDFIELMYEDQELINKALVEHDISLKTLCDTPKVLKDMIKEFMSMQERCKLMQASVNILKGELKIAQAQQ